MEYGLSLWGNSISYFAMRISLYVSSKSNDIISRNFRAKDHKEQVSSIIHLQIRPEQRVSDKITISVAKSVISFEF